MHLTASYAQVSYILKILYLKRYDIIIIIVREPFLWDDHVGFSAAGFGPPLSAEESFLGGVELFQASFAAGALYVK